MREQTQFVIGFIMPEFTVAFFDLFLRSRYQATVCDNLGNHMVKKKGLQCRPWSQRFYL